MDFAKYEVMDMPDPGFPVKFGATTTEAAGPVFPAHWHEHLEILAIREGRCVLDTGGGESVPAEAGDLLVSNPGEMHRLANPGGRLSYDCLIVHVPQLVDQDLDAASARCLAPIAQGRVLFATRVRGDDRPRDCLDAMLREFRRREPGFEMEILSRLLHLLVLLLRHHARTALTPREQDSRKRKRERLDPILQHIERHYDQRITTADCARRVNLTESGFCHLFREMTGTSLGAYLARKRMGKAATLLRETTLPVAEVALATGYGDLPHFTRTFSRMHGRSPSAFRRLAGGGAEEGAGGGAGSAGSAGGGTGGAGGAGGAGGGAGSAGSTQHPF